MNLHITTPFGRRPVTPAQIRAQVYANGCPNETTAHKWTVFRDIATVRMHLGLSDRALAVLDALLTFHPETALSTEEGPGLVVFPSNAALALRAHGIAESTLRRHLAALVEAGVIIRRDSPNGKRYVRRGQGGSVAQAFGFDLTPLVARAAEFASLAASDRAAALALRVARERVTLLRRDCAKLIFVLESAEDAQGATGSLRNRYSAIVSALTGTRHTVDLEAMGEALAALIEDIGKLLISLPEISELSGNADCNERHIQNSKPEILDSELASRLEGEEPSTLPLDRAKPMALSLRTTENSYSLGLVLDACPDIVDFTSGGIRSWRDFVDAADLVRSALGISSDAWRDAKETMGPDAAAVTVAAILQRAEHIKSPGGYLRSLVKRKRAGEYSLGPVLQALLQSRLKVPNYLRSMNLLGRCPA